MRSVARIMIGLVLGISSVWSIDLAPFAGPDAPLMQPRKLKIMEQWKALTVDSYRLNGVHNPAWDDDLIHLLNYVLADVFYEDSDLTPDQATALAAKLTAPGGCTDPLALWSKAMIRYDKDVRQYHLLKEAALAFDKDWKARPQARRHPIILQAMCMGRMLAYFNRETSTQPHPSALYWAKRVGTAYAESIRQRECAQQPIVWLREIYDIKINHNNLSAPVVDAIERTLNASDLDGWVKDGIKGALRINHAWAYRGCDWGHEVTADGWEGFNRELSMADECLTRAWKDHPTEPLIPAFGGTVAGAGQSRSSQQEWFERAERACFDHAQAFDTYIHFSRPRWGGSYQKMIDLGCDCVDTGRYDTEVPFWLMRAIKTARVDALDGGNHTLLAHVLDRPRVRQAVRSSLATFRERNPNKAIFYTCYEAAYQAIAGHAAEAAATLAGVADDQLDQSIAKGLRVNLKVLKHEAKLSVPE